MNRLSQNVHTPRESRRSSAIQAEKTVFSADGLRVAASTGPITLALGAVMPGNVREIIQALERHRPQLHSVHFTLAKDLAPEDLERFLSVLAGHREIESLVVNESLTLCGPELKLCPQDDQAAVGDSAPLLEHVVQFMDLVAHKAFQTQDHQALKLLAGLQPGFVLALDARPTCDQARWLSTCGVGYSIRVPADIDELAILLVLMDDAATCPAQVRFDVPPGATHLISAQLYYVMSLDSAVTDFVIEGANRLPQASSPVNQERLGNRQGVQKLTLRFDPSVKGLGAGAELIGQLAPAELKLVHCSGSQLADLVETLSTEPRLAGVKHIDIVAYAEDPSATSYAGVLETLLQPPFAVEQLALFTPSQPMSVEDMTSLRERIKTLAESEGVLKQVSIDGRWKYQNALRETLPLFHFDARSPLMPSDYVEQIRQRSLAWEAMTPDEQMFAVVAGSRGMPLN